MTDPGERRSGAAWRHMTGLVLAHTAAVTAGSAVFTLTGTSVVLLDWFGLADAGPGSPLPPASALVAAPLLFLISVFAGAIFALPASLVGWPLAWWVVRAGWRGWRLLALGGVAGLLLGLPLLVAALGSSDWARFLADPIGKVLASAPLFGPAAMAAGAGLAWATGRWYRPR